MITANVIYKLLAIGFPAGYRFIAISLVAHFCASNVSDYFAQSFFMISLLATFSGFAVSSQSYVVFRNLSLLRRTLMVVVFLGAASVPCYFLWNSTLEDYFISIFAALGYSIFEISRTDLASKGKFRILVLQGVIAVCLLALMLLLWCDSQYILVTFIFWTLAGVSIIGNQNTFGGEKLSLSIFKDVASYSISNGFSSGLVFIIPMLLIAEYGEGAATELAQVVTLSTILAFYPKYLSAGFLIDLRRSQNWVLTIAFERKVIIYSLAVSMIFLIGAIAIFHELTKYLMLFVAIQFSQIALPHACVHAVLGHGPRMLRVNIMSLLLFTTFLLPIYLFIDKGSWRGGVILAFYLIYNIFRTIMTRSSCKNILLPN